MSEFERTKRNRVTRLPERAKYDEESIFAIIDEALICHVGFVQDGKPIVIPTIHARDGNRLLLHGSSASRMLRHFKDGHDLCVTITLLDGLVLARSVFHHSMNYRSVVLFGNGRIVEDQDQKLRGLNVLTNHLIPGRWDDARQPSEKEMKATTLISMSIDEGSAKIRTGHPGDDAEDYDLPVWAGVIPIQQQALAPIDDERLTEGISAPEYVINYSR
ncbi:MAG: pyridoxamine 5'-phosphate oxidase family protein [Rhodothermia bacterium]|nr:MAG: pyridoxamine 5'-phosphate oxidase family protein [Rhodothermia bacterium]